MIQAILFDLDGVLVGTDVLHFRAWQALARRLGIPFTRDQGARCRGVSRLDSLDIVLEGADRPFSQAEKLALAEEKNQTYRALLESLTPADAAPGAVETLTELRRRGYRLALASGSGNAGLILARTGLGALLDAAADGTCVKRSKPHPEVFLTAARLVGAPAERCAAVDDAAAGIQAGRAAGMLTVAVGDAARRGLGDHAVTGLKELLTLFPGPGAGGGR